MAKHAVPKKKTSRARGNRRYKHFQNLTRKRLTNEIQLVSCPCGAITRQHHVCAACGKYRDIDVLRLSSGKEEAVTVIKAD